MMGSEHDVAALRQAFQDWMDRECHTDDAPFSAATEILMYQAWLAGRASKPPSGGRWTEELPKVAGWYWWFDRADYDNPSVVEVYPDADEKLWVILGDGDPIAIKDMVGEWSGPVEPPREE